MSSIYKEVGIKTILKFAAYSFLQVIYFLTLFPPPRKFFLQMLGAKIGSGSIIMGVKFFNWHKLGPKGLTIGNNCFIGDETLLDLYGPITLENHVTIAQRTTVITHMNVGYKQHPLQKFFPKTVKGVIFKEGSAIGASSTILPGATIGEKSFVAAGSVVTKNVKPHTLVAGVPARLKRELN